MNKKKNKNKYLLLIVDLDPEEKDKYYTCYDLFIKNKIKVLKELLGNDFNNPGNRGIRIRPIINTIDDKYKYDNIDFPSGEIIDIKYMDINNTSHVVDLHEYDNIYVFGGYKSIELVNLNLKGRLQNPNQKWYITGFNYIDYVEYDRYISYCVDFYGLEEFVKLRYANDDIVFKDTIKYIDFLINRYK